MHDSSAALFLHANKGVPLFVHRGIASHVLLMWSTRLMCSSPAGIARHHPLSDVGIDSKRVGLTSACCSRLGIFSVGHRRRLQLA